MDVLVVGAGPVGLMAAHELLRRGVSVRLVDAAEGPATTSRAAAVHARTMEMLDQVGLYEAFDARAVQGAGIAFHADGQLLGSMDARFTRHATRFDKIWFIDQAITESLLRDAVHELGGRVEWGVRLRELTQHHQAVRAVLDHAGGAVEELEVPWLVGCDGGHSVVREQLGVRLHGESSETWLIADAELEFADPLPHDRIRWVRADGASTMIFPLAGERRWRLLDTGDVDHGVDHGADPDEVAKRFATTLSRGLGTEVAVERPSWVSVFTIQQRAVATMQSRRCFVAGDAAHVHSPASGQGLNTGLQDAVNLAWKLAAVIGDAASPELLDTYSAERVPVGRALLDTTRMATMLVALRNAVVDEHLPAVFEVVNALPPVLQAINQGFLGGMSGLGIAYPASPLTVPDADTTRPGPMPGQRLAQVRPADAESPGWRAVLAALRGATWSLLAGPGSSTRADPVAVPDLASPVEVTRVDGVAAAQLGLTASDAGQGWVLVRPDGYVAARGHGQARLDRAVSRLPL